MAINLLRDRENPEEERKKKMIRKTSEFVRPSVPSSKRREQPLEVSRGFFEGIRGWLKREKPIIKDAKRGKILYESIEESAPPSVRRTSRTLSRKDLEEKTEQPNVNLIPEEISSNLDPKQRFFLLGGVVGILLFLIGSTYVALVVVHGRIQGKTKQVQQDIAAVESEIQEFQEVEEETRGMKRRIDAASQLLDSHIHWSRFLSALEEVTLPDVTYTNLAGTTAGVVTLEAIAPDLTTLSQQYVLFQQAETLVSNVEMSSSSAVEGGVAFTIVLTVKPEIFLESSPRVR